MFAVLSLLSFVGFIAGISAVELSSTVTEGGSGCTYSCGVHSTSGMTTGSNGLNLITAFEGWSSKCYKDSGGTWTIGYGHACQSSADELPQYGVTCHSGKCSGTLTQSEGKKVLNDDLA